MWLTRIAVRRPVTTVMVCLIVALLGAVSLQRLSIDLMPDITWPTISVTTLYRGAGPEEIETLLTRPIEQAVSSVQGVERVSSSSAEGASTLRVQLAWGADIQSAVDDIRQSIDRVRAELPDEVDPPQVRKYDSSDSPILFLGVTSELEPTKLTRLAETVVLSRLERVDGVGRVRLRGAVRREIQIELDLAKMSSLGMGVNEVLSALRSQNVTRPAGNVDEGNIQRLVRSRGEFDNLKQVRRTVVREQDGAVVRVADVAKVIDGIEERTEHTRINGSDALMIYIYKQAGANTVAVSDGVHEAVADLNRSLRDAQVTIRTDRSEFIRQSIANVRNAASLGMGLAALVLIIFLRNVRSTFVIGVSMPLAVLATFVLIYQQGFTLNMVSFGGLALGIGLLVDNSIVVIESIFRKHDDGMDAIQASLVGTQEVSGAITASTLTTLVVFLPLLFTEGMTGIMLHQLAWVVSFSLVCSLLASLTLTPMLTARMIRRRKPAANPQPSQPRRREPLLDRAYARLLRGCLRFPLVTAAVLLLMFAVSVGMLPRVGTEFLPKTDDADLRVDGEMAAGIQVETLARQTAHIETAVAQVVPEAINTAAFIGDDADDSDEWNQTFVRVTVQPRSERNRGIEEIREALADEIGSVAGMEVRVRTSTMSPLRFMSRSGADLDVEIRGHSLEQAEKLAESVAEKMKAIEGFANVRVELPDRRPETSVRVDRTKANISGITVADVADALATTVGGTPATVFREEGDEFDVLVRLREDDRNSPAKIRRVGVTNNLQELVPLRNLVRFENASAPMVIRRLDRQRTIEVSADVKDRDLGSVVAELQSELNDVEVPEGFAVVIGGQYEEQQKSFGILLQGLILAVLLMYMVMASQFESLRDPVLILVTLPLAAIGVVWSLLATETTLNTQSFIGLVMLAGLVVNNAIVLVDYVGQLRRDQPDASSDEIIVRAGVRRLRPIIMTTLTTVLAMFPIALSLGEGGELQAPMARVVIGGLLSATVTTLVAIPLLLSLTRGKPKPPVEAKPAEIERVSQPV